MTEKSDPLFSHIKAMHFDGPKKQIANNEYISAEDLAELIKNRGDVPVPDAVLDYVCKHLAGEIPKPKGRRPLPEAYIRQQNMIIGSEYRRLFEVLQAGDLSAEDEILYGEEDPNQVTATPAERAARLVAKTFLYGADSWRTVQNIAASHK
ncbi:MAG: hypothetical protein AAGL99_13215 [Pseudomonadota bacterium]